MEVAENWVDIIPVEAGIIYTGDRKIYGEAKMKDAKMPYEIDITGQRKNSTT